MAALGGVNVAIDSVAGLRFSCLNFTTNLERRVNKGKKRSTAVEPVSPDERGTDRNRESATGFLLDFDF